MKPSKNKIKSFSLYTQKSLCLNIVWFVVFDRIADSGLKMLAKKSQTNLLNFWRENSNATFMWIFKQYLGMNEVHALVLFVFSDGTEEVSEICLLALSIRKGSFSAVGNDYRSNVFRNTQDWFHRI